MKSKNRVKAFTLLELIVVMIISGIVFTLAGGVYFTWLKTYKTWQSNKESEQTLYLFENRLSREVKSCTYMKNIGSGLYLTFDNHPPINYKFNKGNVLRVAEEVVDTFKFNVNSSSFRTLTIEKQELIDQISLNVVIKVDTFDITILKTYTNESLFNLSNHGNSN